jgi:CheY-like chemotaxis protein
MDKILHILILEDRVSDADLMEFRLQEAGIVFTSQRVEKERDYVRALQEFSPDLILSDYDLPQYTGTLALAEAKRLCPEVPFILVTGAIDEIDGLYGEIIAQGARECVLKNHLERLAPAVRRVLRASGGNGNGNGAGRRES